MHVQAQPRPSLRPTPSMRIAFLAAALASLLALTGGSTPLANERPADPLVPVLVGKLSAGDHAPEALVARIGGRVVRQLRLIDGFRADVPRSAVPVLRALGGIRFVTPDPVVHLEAQMGQDSGTASGVYTDATRASKAWAMGVTGKGVNVAVIDTGINTSGDLAGKVIHAEDFTPEADNQDNYGHGTFVAGLIAGSGAASNGAVKGVAPDAGLVALKIAGRDGATDVTRVLEALEWVVDYKDAYGIRVVNLSLGFSSPQSYLVDPLDFAVERVWNAGVVVVAAAGNGGSTSGTVTKPGDDPMVITAGASDDRTTVAINDDVVASFSSWGTTGDGVVKPDLVTSGRSVISSRSPGSTVDVDNPSSAIGDSYARGSGTSFSTAVTAGAAALVIQRTWSLTPDQVKHRLTATARVLGGGITSGSGAGTLDAFAATFSVDDTPANVGVLPALGGGSLQATRGSACIRSLDTDECLSDAEADAALGFDPTAYFGDQWAGSQWVGSQWVSTDWDGSQWVGSQWVGSQWVGSQWVSSDWAGSQWVGSQWVNSAGPWAGWEQ